MDSNLEIYEATFSKLFTVSSKNMGAHTLRTPPLPLINYVHFN